MTTKRLSFDELRELINKQPTHRKPPSDEEHRIQCAYVRWFRLQFPHLAHNLFAVPNGGRRDKVTGAKLKAEGALAGVSDLILLKRNAHYGALLIEFKTPKGKQSEQQKEWQRKIEADGYKYVICRSFDAARQETINYLKDI